MGNAIAGVASDAWATALCHVAVHHLKKPQVVDCVLLQRPHIAAWLPEDCTSKKSTCNCRTNHRSPCFYLVSLKKIVNPLALCHNFGGGIDPNELASTTFDCWVQQHQF